MPVIEHSTIDQSGILLGVGLEVLIVCRDDPEGSLIIEAMQESLCDGSTYRRLCPPSKLIDEYQALPVTPTDELLHISQMGAVGTQVILYGLLITDIDVELVKEPHSGVLQHRDWDATLY